MMLKPETADMDRYLEPSDIIDFNHELVRSAANSLMPATDEYGYARRAYEYVRDTFPHSFDLFKYGKPVSQVSCKASDVIAYGHGICYAKGNKYGVDAQFRLDDEKLAFPVRPDLGEEDGFTIYAGPSPNVLAALKKSNTIEDLIDNLPDQI